jgi:hypothetical protein
MKGETPLQAIIYMEPAHRRDWRTVAACVAVCLMAGSSAFLAVQTSDAADAADSLVSRGTRGSGWDRLVRNREKASGAGSQGAGLLQKAYVSDANSIPTLHMDSAPAAAPASPRSGKALRQQLRVLVDRLKAIEAKSPAGPSLLDISSLSTPLASWVPGHFVHPSGLRQPRGGIGYHSRGSVHRNANEEPDVMDTAGIHSQQ